MKRNGQNNALRQRGGREGPPGGAEGTSIIIAYVKKRVTLV